MRVSPEPLPGSGFFEARSTQPRSPPIRQVVGANNSRMPARALSVVRRRASFNKQSDALDALATKSPPLCTAGRNPSMKTNDQRSLLNDRDRILQR